ncbi:MAG: 2-oxo acid dehydrogenase subunit E2 [Rubrivivax sp.]|nr:2-oxo acid dehydrogenase subunit E2 [Rubrivivax sp.]
MRHAWLLPKLGLTMTEGVLAEWTVAPGARFKAGDCVFVVENDKAASEVAAEHDGVMEAPLVQVGDTVAVGTVIGHWDDGLDAAPAAAAPAGSGARQPAAEPSAGRRAGSEARQSDAAPPGGRRPVTPWARKLANRHGVDLAAVAGSGPGGRVRGRDVEKAASAMPAAAGGAAVHAPAGAPARAPVHAPVHAPEHAPVQAPVYAPQPDAGTARVLPATPLPLVPLPGGTVQPFSALRHAVARRLVAAKQQIPHFYLAREVEVSALLDLHKRLKDPEAAPRLTLNHFIVAAVGRALVAHPELNRVWCEEGALRLDAPDVGVAVHTERGLVVPVLRNAGRLGVGTLARQAGALVERACKGRLSADEMAGAAITVSNAGMHGLAAMASIIVPGQSMILGVGAVRELFRPDAAGAPALRREIVLTLSLDHRVLDGVEGAALLAAVVDALAHPTRLLFD